MTHNDRAYPMSITIHHVQTSNFVSSKKKCRANFCITAKYIKLLSHSWFAYIHFFSAFGPPAFGISPVRHSDTHPFIHALQSRAYLSVTQAFLLYRIISFCQIPSFGEGTPLPILYPIDAFGVSLLPQNLQPLQELIPL